MKRQRNPGQVWERNTPGFDAAVLATSFSGRSFLLFISVNIKKCQLVIPFSISNLEK